MIRTFSEAEIARVLTYERLIPAMERALAEFSAGEVLQPVRTMLTIEEGQRFLGVMPAVTHQAMGAKLVCFYPKNAVTGLPTHMATIVLIEPETGRPLACLDGRLITEMRTAAVSAAVTRHVAREREGADADRQRRPGACAPRGATPRPSLRGGAGLEPHG
jgi:ornithine cyclodeaminase/alanine dehydrogenase-like protein (mu-crystallin family)